MVIRSSRRRLARDIDMPIVDLATHPSREVTLKVLAAYLQCDPRTLIRMMTDREQSLVGYKVGREWRIPTSEARAAFPVKQQVTTSIST